MNLTCAFTYLSIQDKFLF